MINKIGHNPPLAMTAKFATTKFSEWQFFASYLARPLRLDQATLRYLNTSVDDDYIVFKKG